SGLVKPEIGNDVDFEIKSQIMKELRRSLFAGTDDEDAHKHVRRALEIADLSTFLESLIAQLCLECFLLHLREQLEDGRTCF
ncbi:hypothetical protein Tco_1462070, partial [Tanacetum coccineum]